MSTVSTERVLRTRWPLLAAVLGLGLLTAGPGWTQVPVDEEGNPIDAEVVGDAAAVAGENLSAEELEALVGPIALYPDDLLAVVLPASAYPLQIVQAARFLEDLENNPGLQPDESWDDSVVALLNYPDVVRMMNEDLEWTYELGEAVVRQQPDVIAAIESFRDKAYAAGNLKSDERQTVTRENGVVEIAPAEEDVIYVPYYEPERVIVYQAEPVYHYYPRPCPVYYYPYPYGYSFASGYFWGVTTAFHIGWLTDHLHVWHHSYWGHPYFGRTYFFDHWWYRRPSIHVHNTFYVNGHRHRPPHHERDGDFWRPRRHSGGALERRASREAYYVDRAARRDAARAGTVDRSRSGRDDHVSRRLVEGRDGNDGARFTRNRAGNALRDGERERRATFERSRADDGASERDAIRFRPRERTELARRDDDSIRFRPRERSNASRERESTRRIEPERRSLERPSTRRADPAPALRERPALRREVEPTQRATPPRTMERSSRNEAASVSRPAPRVSRPSSESRPAPRVSRPSSESRPAPRVSRPSSTSRPAPRVSRPSSTSRPAPRASRPSSSASHSAPRSRPSGASGRSSSSSRAAAPTSRSSAPRSRHRD